MTSPLLFVDAARGVGMTLVVFVHVCLHTRGALADWWPGGAHATALFGLAVPLFFLLSGLVYGAGERRAEDAGREVGEGAFWRRKLRTLVVPMWLWTAIQLVVGEVAGLELPASEKLFRALLGDWQLYFIVALLQCFGVARLLRGHWRRRGTWTTVLAAGALTAAFYGLSSYLLWAHGGVERYETHGNRFFGAWAVWFFAGVHLGYASGALERFGARWWLWLALAAAAYPGMHWELRREEMHFFATPHLQFTATGFAYQLFGGLALLALFWRAERARWGRPVIGVLARLAPSSFGVYLVHVTLLLLLHWQLQRHELTDGVWGRVYVEGGLTWLASLLLVWFLSLPGVRVVGAWLLRPGARRG